MLQKLFGFDPAKNNVRTEIVAGITTFLTMAYILAVNPSIFSTLGDMPNSATAPALVIVGMMMMQPVTKISWTNYRESIPAFLTVILMPMSYSISDGILIGMIAYVALNAVTGIFDHQYLKKITPTMWILAILFVLRYIFI